MTSRLSRCPKIALTLRSHFLVLRMLAFIIVLYKLTSAGAGCLIANMAFMFRTRRKTLRLDRNLLRSLPAISSSGPGIVLTAVLTSCSLASGCGNPAGKPQIQGGNLRIEFDNHLRSRVVARFDNKETVLGPFTASETVTTAGKVWTEFLLTSQKQAPIKDAFGEGKRLTVEGKAGALKEVRLRHRIRRLPRDGVLRCPVHQYGNNRARGQELDQQRVHDERATR